MTQSTLETGCKKGIKAVNADLFNALYDLKSAIQSLLKRKNGKLLLEHNVIKDGEALEAYQELNKAIVESYRALQEARK